MSVLIQLALVVILCVSPLFGYEVPENERAEFFFEYSYKDLIVLSPIDRFGLFTILSNDRSSFS